MNIKVLIYTVPLAAALIFGQVYAQGNPHLDSSYQAQKVARFQGNPHLEPRITMTRYVERYRGNPHEGEVFSVARVAKSSGNPHAGFEISPLKVASYE